MSTLSAVERNERILEIKRTLKERDKARTEGNFGRSDLLRDQLVKNFAIEIIDQPNGPSGFRFKDGSSNKLDKSVLVAKADSEEPTLGKKRSRDESAAPSSASSSAAAQAGTTAQSAKKPRDGATSSKQGICLSQAFASASLASVALLCPRLTQFARPLIAICLNRMVWLAAEKKQPSAEKARNSSIMASIVGSSGSARTVQGIKIEDVQLGSGEQARPGRRIKVHYVGKLTSGKMFDASTKKPFTFRLGASEVIRGWDIGCDGMLVGGKRKLTIPPEKAYGKRGAPPTIPPNATLVFEVTLLDVM